MLNTVLMVDTVREKEEVILAEVTAGEEEGVIVEAEETAVGEAEETAAEVEAEEVEEATEQQCSVSSFQHQAALKENFGLRSNRIQGGKTLSL